MNNIRTVGEATNKLVDQISKVEQELKNYIDSNEAILKLIIKEINVQML